MISAKTRRNIRRVLPFGMIWLIFAIVYSLLEKGLLGDLSIYPATGNPYEFKKSFFLLSLSAFILGSFIGFIEISYLDTRLKRLSLSKKIGIKLLVYLCIIFTVLVFITWLMTAARLGSSLNHTLVIENLKIFSRSFAFLSISLFMALIIIVSLFYSEMTENLGQGVLQNFFTGKYHRPKVEQRIFMFLDMKSSTQIAEKLGHVTYFQMLQEYYEDLSDPIVKYMGEVYQYVGDEIVVSWNLKNGRLGNNCIHCFYAMKKGLASQSRKYEEKYGVIPAFKAGIHIGEVTTGEIGVLKKEIIFSGDVLNTTARIQGLCNNYGTDILISDALLQKLQLTQHFKVTALGETNLRGKEEVVQLYSLTYDPT